MGLWRIVESLILGIPSAESQKSFNKWVEAWAKSDRSGIVSREFTIHRLCEIYSLRPDGMQYQLRQGIG